MKWACPFAVDDRDVVPVPLVAMLAALSRSIGRGSNRTQSPPSSSCYLLGSFAAALALGRLSMHRESPELSLKVAYVLWGLSMFSFGLVSLVVSVLLLRPASNVFFRDMTQWRRSNSVRVSGPWPSLHWNLVADRSCYGEGSNDRTAAATARLQESAMRRGGFRPTLNAPGSRRPKHSQRVRAVVLRRPQSAER